MSASSDVGRREANRIAWDRRTAVHLESVYYNVAEFMRGASSLKPPEIELVGVVEGVRLLHLQCHFGLDTISWARRGAIATGVDFSTAAIVAAQAMADDESLDVEFVCADVQDLETRDMPFDLVVASYGVMCWLESLDAWASGIWRNLREGGRFVLVEFHPILEVIHPGKVSGSADYFGLEAPSSQHATGTYTNPDASIAYCEYRWQHTISDVIGALLRAGLTIEGFREYPYCSYRLCDELDTLEDGLWRPRRQVGHIPYMYSVVARRPAG